MPEVWAIAGTKGRVDLMTTMTDQLYDAATNIAISLHYDPTKNVSDYGTWKVSKVYGEGTVVTWRFVGETGEADARRCMADEWFKVIYS